MDKVMAFFGGRKAFICMVAIVLVALRDVLGIDEAAISRIVTLALGGSGVIAFEDAISKALTKPKKPTK